MNCSRSGYQLRFYPYRGKAEQRPENVSATAFPAYVLLQDEKYHHKNFVRYTDNWFTSFNQLHILRERGIHFVGTVKGNRGGLPKRPQGRQPKRIRGEFNTKSALFIGSPVYYTEWQDKKPFKILHTIKTYRDTCTRKTGQGKWVVASQVIYTANNCQFI